MPPPRLDGMSASLVLRGGTIVDGTGAARRRADVLVDGDRVVTLGEVSEGLDADVLDATGHVLVPRFVNMLSHAWGSLQVDSTGASELLQGATTEVFGEAFSPGPRNDSTAEALRPWAELGTGARTDFARLSDGLSYLESRGVAPNVASFVGGVTCAHSPPASTTAP